MFVVWEEFNILEGTGKVDTEGKDSPWVEDDEEAKSTNRSSRSIFFNDYEPTISNEENAYE